VVAGTGREVVARGEAAGFWKRQNKMGKHPWAKEEEAVLFLFFSRGARIYHAH